MRLHLLAAVAPLVLLTACAGTTSGPRHGPYGAGDVTSGLSSYGMFLAGEAALNDGKSGEAARFFDQARQQGSGEALVSERAFTAALLSGDVDKAANLSPTGDEATEAGKRLGKLVVAINALADGRSKQAKEMLAGENIAFPHRSAAALVAPWAAAGAGDLEGSLVRPQVRGDRAVDYFGQLGQGALFERAKRFDEAETDFKALVSLANPSVIAIMTYGEFLERRGRRVDALALYETFLSAEPSSLPVKAARTRASAGKPPPPQPSIREGAAQAMLGATATMIQAQQTQTGLAYLRLVLKLDPQKDAAWVMVGDIMQGLGDTEGARAAFAHPKAGSPEYGAAQAKLAWTYQSADDKETALKLARAGAVSGDVDARITLSDLLRSNEQYGEAAEILTGLINESKTPDWRLRYSRGIAYERMNRWPEAQADLQAALTARPDEPEILNYLGYSLIDRGERLKDAMGMVERAVATNPRSGAMIDSLGWAYYRLGDYKKAVEKLEQAVEFEAGDPDINNHLGDAYWKAGRRDEAQFQWRRVLTLNPDARIKASAEAKLASGLGPEGPAPKVADK